VPQIFINGTIFAEFVSHFFSRLACGMALPLSPQNKKWKNKTSELKNEKICNPNLKVEQ